MTKQDILNTTGLSEEEFYQRYPDQETFCSEYPDMCPDMMDDEEDMSNNYNIESSDDDSLYEAEDGVETTAPYTDYNQYKNAMQTYGTESAKANTYNNFQNDLYSQSGKQRGFSETPRQMGDMFNTLSPEQQDAMAAKYNAEFVPAGTPSANRRNYINSMEMNIPGKGMGYYSFPTNDVVYGNKQLERPNYNFPKMTMAPYKMPQSPKKFDIEPTQLINSISASYKDPASFNKNNGNLPIPKYSMANTMEKVGATNQPFVTSAPNYKSIIDLLKARKQDSSFTNRKKLAEERGIKNYTGTASQNMELINNIDNFNPYDSGMELGGENMFVNGGLIKYQKKGEVKQNPPKVYTDKKKFEQAQKMYTDSLNLYKGMQMQDKLMGDNTTYSGRPLLPISAWTVEKLKEARKSKIVKGLEKYGPMADDFQNEKEMFTDNYFATPNDKKLIKYYKSLGFTDDNIMYHSSADLVHPKIKAIGTYFDGNAQSPIYKKPVQPVIYQPASTHPIEHLKRMEMMAPFLNSSNIQMQRQPIPVPQMRLPQKGNIPFYGPGNSIIGYTDDNMQFYPAQQYTGASNNQLNLLDKELLDNPEMLQKYVLSKNNYNFELGGINIHPAMRTNFKQGGYYGMDGKLHRAKGTGTYVMNGGYYFQDGGGAPVASPDTPPGAIGDPAAVSPSSLIDSNMPNEDGTFNVNNDYNYYGGYDGTEDDKNNQTPSARQQRRQARRNAPYETPDLGGLDSEYEEEQQQEEPVVDPYDASQYSSGINPATGFTTWSKGNQQLTNIKKQDPVLWGHLKDEGHGARWRTGQTDFQKFGRAAGKFGNTLDATINVAGAIGNLLNNRNQDRNLNNAAINKGSTASMYTNPQGAGKGDYGKTGSSYGMMNPASVGERSFKGMYGKYGMQVPMYNVGGFVPQFSTLADVGLEPMANINDVNDRTSYISQISTNPFLTQPLVVSPKDNLSVYQNNQNVNSAPTNTSTLAMDPDFALQAMGLSETGSKPGESKTGLRTKIVGEGGKRASASGTFQITNDTLQDIYNNDKSISSKYGSFNKFKSAFDTDAKVEYEAAKSLMSRHIKNYGVYALGAWYYPEFARKAAAGDKSVFDIVPRRDFGNSVKWGDDFNKKLKAYNKLAGTNYTPTTVFNEPSPVAQTSKTSKGNKPHKQQGTSWHADYNRFENPMLRPTLKEVMKSFPGTSLNGVWPSPEHLEQNPNSDHNTGDGLDITIQNIDQGNKVAEKLIREAKAKNIKYIIFNSQIWEAETNKWSPYTGKNPHKTHLHASFNPYRKKQLGGQVVEMDEDEIKQFLKAGGQLEFLD
jgi:peptidoglycan L-alanyl-D-glutamate endopeptidase CwlK